uniref:Uncharacterized protein n=2 Tax=Arundo donax TaxID=35708 RepID=A0A0A9BVV0_ARUDO
MFSLKFFESLPSLFRRFSRYGGGSFCCGRLIFPCLQQIPNFGSLVPMLGLSLSSFHSRALQYLHLHVGFPKFHISLSTFPEGLLLLDARLMVSWSILSMFVLARFASFFC